MAEIIVMPKMNLVMEEGFLSQWYKAVGDSVAPGEPLCSVENEKETADVESPCAGVLLKIWGAEGERYPVKAPIALLGSLGEDIAEITERVERELTGDVAPSRPDGEIIPQAAEASGSAGIEPSVGVKMLPKLRKMIKEKGINLDELLAFTGKYRVTEKDILDFEAARMPCPGARAFPTGERRERMSGMRRAIANNMAESCSNTARLTNVTEVDMTNCLKEMGELKEKGQKASLTAMIVKACALSLREHESINSSLEGDEIVYHSDIHVGCAVDVPGGLVVPVIRNADQKDVFAITAEIADFTKRGLDSALTSPEMSGGTFTVSNVGMLGVELFTPIINYPQAAIMGVGSLARLPRYLDDVSEILVPRHVMKLSLTYDHRIIDGAPAARFSLSVRELLQNPALLLR